MLLYIRDKLNTSIRHKDFEYFVKFSDINIECIECFLYFHNNDEDEISYFDKTVDED